MSAGKREQRREHKQQLLKQARALYTEWCQLDRKTRNAELVPLDEPYQRGWVRYFRWTDDAVQREDFEIIKGLLEFMQHKQWSRRQDFRYSKQKKRRVIMGWKARLSFHPHQLLHVCRNAQWPKYFQVTSYWQIQGIDHLRALRARGWNGKVRFKYPNLLEGVVEPYYVTHQKVRHAEEESRMAEIDAWFEQRGGWEFIARTMGWRSWHDEHERHKKLKRVTEKEVREELERRGIFRAFRVFGEWW